MSPLFLPLTSSFLTKNIRVYITTNTGSLRVKDSISVAMMMEVRITVSNIIMTKSAKMQINQQTRTVTTHTHYAYYYYTVQSAKATVHSYLHILYKHIIMYVVVTPCLPGMYREYTKQ